MSAELGERLVEVGLLTQAQLSRSGVAPHGAALARRLVDEGLVEDALAGFFLAEGFGPLASSGELAQAEAHLVELLPAQMAHDFLVLPLRETGSGVLVAMAVPSDRHLVREVARLVGKTVLPTVARVSELIRALEARLPSAAPPPEVEEEPVPLQLVRRRPSPSLPALASELRAPTPSVVPAADDDVPIALVRHKPIASRAPAPPEPPSAPVASALVSPAKGAGKLATGIAKTFPAPVDRAASAGAFRASRGRKGNEGSGKADRSTTSEYGDRPSAPAAAAGPAPAPAPAPTPAPAPASAPAPTPAPAPAPASASASAPASASASDPTAAPPAGDRWDLPAAQAKPEAKLTPSRASLPSSKAAAGDIAPTLAAMKTARDRDAIVRLACEGAISIGRSAVFLALRKGVLKGWDGAGQGVSRDSVRNLWIPAGSDSMFKRVLDSGAPFVGAYGSGIADGLFRAAVGSRGGDVAVWPVSLEGKVVGLLCVDDLRPGSISRHRVETLTVGIAEGFRRLISTGKNE